LGWRQLASRERLLREVRPSQRQQAARTTASLKCVFMRVYAGKMERDPGARRRSHEKIGVSDIDTRISHPCNKAKLPSACSEATTGQNQGTSRITQSNISRKIEYMRFESVREPGCPRNTRKVKSDMLTLCLKQESSKI
jgi:hypothetical protein